MHLEASEDVGLQFCRLDASSLRLVTNCDAGFGNRLDNSSQSQCGFITLLIDKTGAFPFLQFRSCRSWRVCKSAMAAETLAFV